MTDMLRVAVMAGSALAAILAARRSLASRDEAAREQHQREYAYEADAGPDRQAYDTNHAVGGRANASSSAAAARRAPDLSWQPLYTPAAAHADLTAADSAAPGGSPERGAALLLWQCAASLLLVAIAPLLRPPAIVEVAWMQLVALACLAALAFPLAANIRSRAAARQAVTQAAATAARPPPPQAALRDVGALNGVWIRDKESSESLDSALDLVHVGGLVRIAIAMLKGAEIVVTPGRLFRFSVLSGIAWFKITESYALGADAGGGGGGGGAERRVTRHRRRDLRGGGSFGSAEVDPGGGIHLHNRWNEPHAGSLDEHFYCPEPGVLHVDAVMAVGEGKVQYRQVYRRKA